MVESRIKQTTESFNPGEDLEPPPLPLPLPLPPNHGWDNASIQSTPDSSNLQGKSKKVRVVGRSKKIAGRKEKKQFLITHLNREVEEKLCDTIYCFEK